ncbi:VOC family protein [Neisseriaceae bacterium JH1-16]|nr:VOC family protein [Neisseriaceae bacterium JH1-16]
MPAIIQQCMPTLVSLDQEESIAFYRDRLGFILQRQDPDYMIMRRDSIELHFGACDDRQIAENTSCYLQVSDVDELHREFVERGLVLPEPSVRLWGMKEFYVVDVHGNLLRFGQPA